MESHYHLLFIILTIADKRLYVKKHGNVHIYINISFQDMMRTCWYRIYIKMVTVNGFNAYKKNFGMLNSIYAISLSI
jgi:hypothetical protein